MELLVLLVPLGAVIGVVPGLLAALAMARFMAGGATILFAGGVLFLVSAAAAAFGAWMGRLRRQHIERMGQ